MKIDNNDNHFGIYVFEGIDNVGKTTIIEKLKNRINEMTDYECFSVAFPGNEIRTLGSLVYDIHHDEKKYFDDPLNNTSLQLLHVASHIDLIHKKLIGKINSSHIVLMDRFWWSTYAYGLSSGLNENQLLTIIKPELFYWDQIVIKKIYLLERDNRECDYSIDKDKEIIQNYRHLSQNDPNSKIIINDKFEETVSKIFFDMLGD